MASMGLWAILAFAIAAGLGLPAAAARGAAGDGCASALVEAIPPRPSHAASASDFVQRTSALSEAARDTAVAAELMAGNLPAFLRELRPVTLPDPRAEANVTICVMPDYLALGSDEDFLRLPMGLPTALDVADRFGFVLPTPRMVDAIYEQAEVRLRPQPLPPGDAMRSIAYFWQHQGQIQAQRLALRAPLGALMAGQKKDVVLTNRLLAKPGRVAIYGWHEGAGRPIQPLSTVHGARYADYSHGVRLVSAVAYVDGYARALSDLLEDRRLARLVSDEGPISRAVFRATGADRQPQLTELRR
jgi:hypothetical protein